MLMLRPCFAVLVILLSLHAVALAGNGARRSALRPALEVNIGQVRDDHGRPADHVRAFARQGAVTSFLHANGAHLVLRSFDVESKDLTAGYTETSYRCDVAFLGGNPMARTTFGPRVGGTVRYYIPGLNGGVADQHASMTFVDVWNGIDVRWFMGPNGMKYEFVVRPGADPSAIALSFTGASGMRLTADGGFELSTPLGRMNEAAPVSWRSADPNGESNIGRADVRFRLDGTVLRFDVTNHDASKTLVIDPAQVWSTYYSGNQAIAEDVRIAKDNALNIVMVGATPATNLPTTVGVVQRAKRTDSGNWDGFVTKFDMDGKHLWSTYYGSTKLDALRDVACDSVGNIWAVGYTNFKDAPNLFVDGDTVKAYDILILKLNPKGAWLDAFTLTGRLNDLASAIDITGQNVTIVGISRSPDINGQRGTPYIKANGTTTPPLPDNNDDAFIARFVPTPNNPDRSRLQWFTFFGGSGNEEAVAVRCNAAGDVFVCGRTTSANLPATQGTYTTGLQPWDTWVARFPSAGGARTWCAYLGGSLSDEATDITVDNAGTPTVVGSTYSPNFPVTPGMDGYRLGESGFIAQFDQATGARSWSTLVTATAGIAGFMRLEGVTTDQSRRIWVIGTRSLFTGWSTTPDAFQPTAQDASRTNDGIIARYSPAGQRQYASYLSATPDPGIPNPPRPGDDFGLDEGIDVLCDGDAYMIFANLTSSDNFPTKNAFQDASNLLSAGLTISNTKNAVLSFFSDCPDSVIAITGPAGICNGIPIVLAGPLGFAKYQWSNGETSRTITVADSGTYALTVVSDKGCRYRDTTRVSFFSSATINAGPDISACKDTLTELSVTITGGTPPFKYKWNRIETGQEFIQGDTTATPKVFPAVTSNYEITTTDANGCVSRDTIRVAVLDPKPTFASSNIDFGILDACSSFGDAGFPVRNPMPFPITITSISSTTGNISDATPLGATGIVVPPGGTVDIVARYTAAAPGVVTGTIIVSGTPCGWTATIPFRADKARLVASVAPGTVSFGVSSACQKVDLVDTVEIRNGGSDPLVVQPAIVAAPYSIVSPTTPITVDPGSTAPVIIRYAPAAAGTFNDQVKLPFTAGACSDTLRVNLSAIASNTSVQALETAIAMPDLSGCETEIDTTVTLRNTGETPVTITWSAGADVVIGATQPLTLAAGQDIVIPITVRPVTTGPYSIATTFTSQPCDITVTVTLTGSKQGVSFDTPPAIDLGEINSCDAGGKTGKVSITFTGTSGDGSVVDVITGPSISTTLVKNATLVAGTPLPFDITWNPTRDGALIDSVVVILKPCDTRRVIRVTGVRTTPSLSAAQAAVNLGTLPVGGATGTLTFRNDGTDTLVVLAGSNTAGIIVTGTRPAQLSSVLPGTTIEVDYSIPCDLGPSISGLINVVGNPCAVTAATTLDAVCTRPPSGGTATIALDTQIVSVGDRVTIPIRLIESSNLNSIGATAWKATVSYDPYILVGTGSTPDCYTEGMMGRCSIEIAGSRGADTVGTIGQLNFTAVLGYTNASAVNLESFQWTSQEPVTTTTRSGRVEIDNICRDRYLLYKRGGIVRTHPQPADDVIRMSLPETSAPSAEVSVYDLVGNMLMRKVISIDRMGDASVDVRQLEAGSYVLMARVADTVRSTMIIIAR